MPPARRPTASSRRLSCRCSSVRRRSVRSSTTPAMVERLASRGIDGAPADGHDPMDAAIGPDHPVLRRERRPVPDRVFPALPGGLAVLRVDRLQPGGVRHGRVRREPEERLRPRVPAHLAGGELVLPGAQASGFERQLQRLLFPAKLLLGVLALGEIAQPPGEAEQPPSRSCTRDSGHRRPEAAAVLPDDPPLGAGPAALGGFGEVSLRRARLAVLGGVEVRGGDLEKVDLLVAEHATDAGVPTGRLALGVQQEDRVVLDLIERRPVPFLALGPRVLDGLLPASSRSSSSALAVASRAAALARSRARHCAPARQTIPMAVEHVERQAEKGCGPSAGITPASVTSECSERRGKGARIARG